MADNIAAGSRSHSILVAAAFRLPQNGDLPRSRWDFPPAGSLPKKVAATSTEQRGLLKYYKLFSFPLRAAGGTFSAGYTGFYGEFLPTAPAF